MTKKDQALDELTQQAENLGLYNKPMDTNEALEKLVTKTLTENERKELNDALETATQLLRELQVEDTTPMKASPISLAYFQQQK